MHGSAFVLKAHNRCADATYTDFIIYHILLLEK